MRTSSPALDDSVGKPEDTPTKVNDKSNVNTKTSHKDDVMSVDAAIVPPTAVADATTDAASMKRAREDDDGVDEQRDSKKVDAKVDSKVEES